MGLVCCNRMAAVVLLFSVTTAHAEVASIYGGSDGLCGHKTASGEPLMCGNDRRPSQAAVRHSDSRLPQRMRHSSHQRPRSVGSR